jgi:hypothetical protein
MTTSEIVDFLKTEFDGHACTTKDDVFKILNEYNTRFYVYLLICDGETIILGQGSNREDRNTKKIEKAGRKDIIFPGGVAFGHQKAFPAAMAHFISKETVRVIIPTQSKAQAVNFEEVLKIILGFGSKHGGRSILAMNMEYLQRRIKQLELNFSDDSYNDFIFCLGEVLNATGCEMQNYKKRYKYFDKWVPEFSSKVTSLFGGYYSDL